MRYYAIGICVRTARKASWECFGQAFSKACAGGGREALLARRNARNSPNGVSFLRTFFFAPLADKEKSGVTNLGVLTATQKSPQAPLRRGKPRHLPLRGRLL